MLIKTNKLGLGRVGTAHLREKVGSAHLNGVDVWITGAGVAARDAEVLRAGDYRSAIAH